MKIQELPKKMYAGLFVVLLMFAVSCDNVTGNLDSDSSDLSLRGGPPGVGAMEVNVDMDDVVLCGEDEVALTAGQHIPVGNIVVGNDGDYLYVTYKTTDDWYLTEVHLYVLDEDPERRLPPGRAPYKSKVDKEKEFTLKIPLGDFVPDFENQCDELSLWLQAHAVVKKIVDGEVVQKETAYGGDIVKPRRGAWYGVFPFTIKCCEEPCEDRIVIYGISGSRGDGGLYEIEIVNGNVGAETLLFSYDVKFGDNFSGNGLAFDEENNRLYFAAGTSDAESSVSDWKLYFYDFDDNIVNAASDLPGEIYGATWGAGKYWFIQSGTDDMYTVSFDADGLNGTLATFEDEIAGGKVFRFGDIALDTETGIIYGSTSFASTNFEFFKYELEIVGGVPVDGTYTLITETGDARGLQLGFAGDGNLYGHSTFGQSATGADPREWFLVDRNDGSVTSLGQGENEYNDLTSGPAFICP